MSGAQTPAPAPSPQPSAEPPAPAIRRWLDVQQIHFASRYRFSEMSDGRVTFSTIEWQPHIRARFLFDRDRRYALNAGVFSGSQFIVGWNHTGTGFHPYTGDVNFKQLFLSAEPVRGVEGQFGGLYPLRGENTEITSYDADGFLVGERVAFRPRGGRVSEIAVTTGYLGDIREPSVFNRFKRLDEWNYGQLLVATRVHPRVNVSADYTYEDTRDILRQGVTVRLPETVAVLRAAKLDLYERVSPDTEAGFNASADLQPARRLTLTLGLASIDRLYGALNGDRYLSGTRAYSLGNYAVTRDLSIGYFWGEAFNNDFNVPVERRFEFLVTFNPTATLKAKRIF